MIIRTHRSFLRASFAALVASALATSALIYPSSAGAIVTDRTGFIRELRIAGDHILVRLENASGAPVNLDCGAPNHAYAVAYGDQATRQQYQALLTAAFLGGRQVTLRSDNVSGECRVQRLTLTSNL